VSIIKLRDWAADKRKFVKVRDYLDFAEAFVEFREKAGNIQAELVARNTPQYRFFQYNSEADYLEAYSAIGKTHLHQQMEN
jgi:hypothetical protein